MISRRALLRGSLAAGAVTVLPAAGLAGYGWAGAGRSNVGRVVFERPLAVPPLLEESFDLDLRAGEAELLPGRRTATWGVNGPYLGPTLRFRRGAQVRPRVRNSLPETTTLHWHGMLLPAVSDGGPHARIAPGTVWQPRWTVDQPAATAWYHPHPHGSTKEHTYRGIAGMILISDGSDVDVLPTRYGVDDVPVIVQDKAFHADGALSFDGIGFGGVSTTGLLGDEILVNGVWGPVLDVRTTRVRLRLLNASNARIYDLAFADSRTFHVVAVDAGPLPAPVAVTDLPLSPGERAEIVVEFAPGERVLLESRPPRLGAHRVHERFAGGDDAFSIMSCVARPVLAPSPPLPPALPAAPGPALPMGAIRRFTLGDFTINGTTFDMARADFAVPLGTRETWEVHNAQGLPHNFHIHNAAFRVHGSALPGMKDTVYLPPGETVRLDVHFGQHPDPHTPYPYHCHLLAHEDTGMMGQFMVVEPGTEHQVRVRPSHAAAHD